MLYMLRDKGIGIGDIIVKTNNRKIQRLLETIAFRKFKRVYKDCHGGKRLWIIKINDLMIFSLEIARRVYGKIWVSPTGLNPIVSFCIASTTTLEASAKRVLEIFAGTATMALESCRTSAIHCIGLD